MASRIVGGNILLPVQGENIIIPIALYWGDQVGNCHYCQKPNTSLMKCALEYGARETVGPPPPEKQEAFDKGFDLVAGAFLSEKGVCGECYDKWQEESHHNLSEALHGKWVQGTMSYETPKGVQVTFSNCCGSPENCTCDVMCMCQCCGCYLN